mmetsp:Transcript_234/g.718  ORF Transcript_234/g.718 Transcript_234/m.718 type:complete len:202 (+) Transcript_234:613-1218(+)
MLQGLGPPRSPDLHSRERKRPDGGHPAPGRGPGHAGQDQSHQPGPRAGPQGDRWRQGGRQQREVGAAAELPPGSELHGDAGGHRGEVRGTGRRDEPRLPALAHGLSVPRLPDLHPADGRQDDHRAAEGAQAGAAAGLPGLRRGVVRELPEAPRVQEDALRPLLLPRSDSGEAWLRARWLERRLRVLGARPGYFAAAAQEFP